FLAGLIEILERALDLRVANGLDVLVGLRRERRLNQTGFYDTGHGWLLGGMWEGKLTANGGSPSPRRERVPPLQELPHSLLPDVLPFLDHQLAAREDRLRRPFHLPALIAGVVDVHVVRRRADGELLVRVEDHDVGVGADGDRALAREESEDLRCRRRRDLDEAVERDPSLRHATIEDERHAVLDARTAVRDLREVATAELFLLLETER